MINNMKKNLLFLYYLRLKNKKNNFFYNSINKLN